MEKMNTSAIGKLMGAFVAIMIAIVLIGQIASVGNGVTEMVPSAITMSINAAKDGAGNTNPAYEFFPQIINDSKTGWRASIDGCGLASTISSMVIGNASETWNTGNYTISATNGSIRFLNTENVNGTLSNVTSIRYNQCPDGYVYGWAATMLKLVYGIFALASLGVAIALFYSIAKDYGII